MARDQKVRNKAAKASKEDVKQTPQAALKASQPVAAQTTNSTVTTAQPSWPSWPTSRPGPRSTPPSPGMHSINPFRPEQVSEVGYNQETGEPGNDSPLRSLPDPSLKDQVSFDQKPTGQETLGKRKKRL